MQTPRTQRLSYGPMRALVVLTLLASTGCATILHGTRNEISITSTIPGATVVVVGGVVAAAAVKAQKVTAVRDIALSILGPHLPPEVKAIVEQASADELLTQLVVLTQLGAIPPEWSQKASAGVQKLPPIVVDTVLEKLGIHGVGVTPYKAELKKGGPWAIVTWAPGTRAKLLVVDAHFDWIFLLNILTAGIGMIVDVVTGAWLYLDPKEFQYTLEPLPEAAPKTEAVSGTVEEYLADI